MRQPRVKNKYNLTINYIRSLEILDRSKIKEPLFWRNKSMEAWCISGNTIMSSKDSQFGTYSSYWLGIRDFKPDKVELIISSYGGMCGYNFNEFYNEEDIENDIDLRIQEIILEDANYLIDEGILAKTI